jgi:hypothetical protein
MFARKLNRISSIALGTALALGAAADTAGGVQAELRSSAALPPNPATGQAAPTATTAGLV